MRSNLLPGFSLSVFVTASALLFAGCPPNPTHEALIHRDVHGVPHVYADTEEEVMGGFAFAMAEDQLETLVTLYRTANGTRVLHNTVRVGDYPGAIELSDGRGLQVHNNLISAEFRDRGGAQYDARGNIFDARNGDFAAPDDFHLARGSRAIGGGVPVEGAPEDIEGEQRGGRFDVGCDHAP